MKEMDDIKRRYLETLKKREREELDKSRNVINVFIQLMRVRGVELTDENFSYIERIGIVAEYPNIIEYCIPDFKVDKDGLFDFNALKKAFDRTSFLNGYLISDKFMVMAHPYFRRGYFGGNSYSPRFIELFWKSNAADLKMHLALDSDRVRINIDNRSVIELDTWFGAKFDSNIQSIPDGISKLRPPLDLENNDIFFLFNDAYSLDVKWSTSGNIKTFQAEEFKTSDVRLIKNGIEYYPTRYIHAEYDLKENTFRHFDGAIHFYSESEYLERREADFNYNEKNRKHIKAHSQKLYRIDGTLSKEFWIELSSHFFTGNPLMIEYFEGKYPENIEEMIQIIRSKKQ